MQNQLVIEGVRVDGIITLVVLIAWILTPLRYLDKVGYAFAVASGGVVLFSLYTVLIENAMVRGGMMVFAAISYFVSAVLLQERFWEAVSAEEGYPARIKAGILVIFALGTAFGFQLI